MSSTGHKRILDSLSPQSESTIEEGIKSKPKSLATDLDLTLLGKLQDKVIWFQIYLKSIHPLHHFTPNPDGTQINVVGGRYYHRGRQEGMTVVESIIVLMKGRHPG